jgi:flagellin
MALGVLNNIAALNAENSLNSTNTSLQGVLQQLSSGSKINSGSDDAAGLSLVNGLQANSTALVQSSTNAQEGVGLLQVADGALSQVTSLLNRAVTLATETANGTLTSTQGAAANQEYQSILSEINNIGSTTTFNSNAVFGGTAASTGVNIYTGDSSQTGSSIDNLHFAALSSSTVGDSGGTVQQSSSGKFFDLTADTSGVVTTAATAGDTIASSLVFTNTSTDQVVTVSAGTSQAAVIAEINKDGISGVTASQSTAGATGLASAGTTSAFDTGILISNTNSNVVITGTLTDSTSGATAAASGGVASTKATETISYQNGANESTTNLATTDLTSAGNAQNALSQINSAISNVAAQRGYLGAQVNTLNAISSVAATQEQNITSAQNAVQATDYAQASTNLSKYEILSQTGISALAQANSLQQEVTKLLQ